MKSLIRSSNAGSSPHTWRILIKPAVLQEVLRIISTYVENTIIQHSCRSFSEDHLHIRGEYSLKGETSRLYKGSSPHTWRIQIILVGVHLATRIISTYVENTFYHSKQLPSYWDHLHIRGEYRKSLPSTSKMIGSSPHTWRIHLGYNFGSKTMRIISTYVENTTPENSISRVAQDHLHIRGEY